MVKKNNGINSFINNAGNQWANHFMTAQLHVSECFRKIQSVFSRFNY